MINVRIFLPIYFNINKIRINDEDLRIREKELKIKEEKQKIESERLNKKDEHLIATANELRNKDQSVRLETNLV